MTDSTRPATIADEALQKLIAGNRRFIAGDSGIVSGKDALKGFDPSAAQRPFAIVLGCSDSRVPAEMVFDCGLGELFVIRVAGNVVAPSQIGSVEFAAEQFGTRLVVVLGHSHCGAVTAALADIQGPPNAHSHNVRSIVDRIRPAVEELASVSTNTDNEILLHQAVRANVRASANHLRHGSQILEDLGERDGLRVVGAEYSLVTGEVDFFDTLPGSEAS